MESRDADVSKQGSSWRQLEFDDFNEEHDVEKSRPSPSLPNPANDERFHSMIVGGPKQRKASTEDKEALLADENQTVAPKLPPLKSIQGPKPIQTSSDDMELISDIKQFFVGIYEYLLGVTNDFIQYVYDEAPQSIVLIVGVVVIVVSIVVIFRGAVTNTSVELKALTTRPNSLHNGVINPMASEFFDIVEEENKNLMLPSSGEGAPVVNPANCVDKYFRCEYYWATDTMDARRLDKTFYCTYYVCKAMTVKVSVFPQTCSGKNRVGIVKHDHDLYYGSPLSYSCSNTGCGECSSAQITLTEGMTLAFLQGCNGGDSCYGQIEVSIIPSDYASTKTNSMQQPKLMEKQMQLRQYLEGAPWPKYRGGFTNQGLSPYKANDLSSIEWKFRTNFGFKSSPVIDNEGTVYIGSDDMSVYAVAANGALKWRFTTQGKVTATCVLSSRKNVYVGSEDANFYSISMDDGSLKWKLKTKGKIFSSAVVGARGIIYFGSYDGHLYAVSSPGDQQWAFSTLSRSINEPRETKDSHFKGHTSGAISTSPALSPIDGTIYFGCDDSFFYAVKEDGKLGFYFKTGQAIYSSPAVTTDGLTIYFGSDDGYLYALSNSGALKFRFKTDDRIRSSPAIAADGTIVVAQDSSSESGMGMVFAITPSGLLKWKYQLADGSVASPTISADGVVYIGADDHCVYAISLHDGSLKDIFKTEGKITASVAVAADGTLYVGSWISSVSAVPSSLYAFGKKAATPVEAQKLPPSPSPPGSVSSWWCSELAGGDIEYRCTSNGKYDIGCLPGLDAYIGRGVDVTYDPMEAKFFKGRVFDFTDIVHPVTFGGANYVAPGGDFLMVTKADTSLPSDELMSGFYSSARDYTLARSVNLHLAKIHSFYPAGKVPHSATLTILANATGIESDLANEAGEAAKQQKYLFVNSASYSSVSYKMRTSSTTRQLCAKSFHQRLQELPSEYDEAIYKKFVQDFGTHVLIGGRLGGSVTTSMSIKACDATAEYPSARDAFRGYVEAAGSFSVNSTSSAFSFLDTDMKRTTQVVVGGKSSLYRDTATSTKTTAKRPWGEWKKSLFADKNKPPAILNPELIPIWATVRPADVAVLGHLSAAVLDYMRAAMPESEVDLSSQVQPCAETV